MTIICHGIQCNITMVKNKPLLAIHDQENLSIHCSNISNVESIYCNIFSNVVEQRGWWMVGSKGWSNNYTSKIRWPCKYTLMWIWSAKWSVNICGNICKYTYFIFFLFFRWCDVFRWFNIRKASTSNLIFFFLFYN